MGDDWRQLLVHRACLRALFARRVYCRELAGGDIAAAVWAVELEGEILDVFGGRRP